MVDSSRGLEIVALLPMKANSERVKGKNFRDFVGKPLFRWVLDTLLSVDAIDKVVINTDAREILACHNVVENERLIIRDRRAEICGDFVSMNRIIEDDISNISSDIYLMTHTTNPLLSKSSVERAIKKYKDGRAMNYDSLFTVNELQTRLYDADCKPLNHNPRELVRTQDLEPVYEENSNLYVFSEDSFSATQSRIGLRPAMLVTDAIESTDIDTPADWEIAEALTNQLIAKANLQ